MIFKKLRLNAFVMAIISSDNKYDSLQWFNAHKRKPYNKLLLITRAAKGVGRGGQGPPLEFYVVLLQLMLARCEIRITC